jgi:hypothetical protein
VDVEMRLGMTFKRLLMAATVASFVLIVCTAYAQDTGGGAAAGPQAAAPDAGAAQDETPTTPGGEEQPPEEQPDGEQPPSQEPTITPPPAEGVGGESTGGLPQTGWQVFALASIGLGLLLAGAALRPTSSWPPPRDRLTR